MISKDTIDKIFSTARIEEVIGDFVSLKKSGSNYKGLSPFTTEKTPSFFVSPSKQIFKCFSSGVGGNVVKFLMEHDQLTYPEALRFLAEKYNIEIEEDEVTPEQEEARSERESLYVVNKFAEEFFTEQLATEEGKAIGLSYFKERGFSAETIDTFRLGYSPDSWDSFLKASKEKGYKEEYLLKTGLIKQGSNNRLYDGYKGRVIFPIHNLSGRPIGFGGRTLKTDKKVPKYINSPESDVYDKSNVLYGLYQAKSAIVKQDACLLVEGYTDVLSLHQNGIKHVVASSGTSLTTGQIRLISRYTKNIVILYDGDAAGIKASFRGIDLILEEGLNVKVVLFPDGEDPDSYSQKLGTEELTEFLDQNAKDFIVFKSSILMKDIAGDPVKKAGVVHEIVNSIALIPDHITRSLYLKECSSIVDVPEKALIAELNKFRKKRINDKMRQKEREQQKQNDAPPPPPFPGDEIPPEAQAPFFEDAQELRGFSFEVEEENLIRFLLNYGNEPISVEIENEEGKEETVEITVAHFLLNDILADEIQFSNPAYQAIVDETITLIESEDELNHQHFTHHANELISTKATDLLTQKYDLHNWERKNIFVKTEAFDLFKSAKEFLYALKIKHLLKLITDLQQELRTCENHEDVIELLKKKRNLDELKVELSSEKGIVTYSL